MKINILLINPVIGFSPPFGLLYIAAMLEKNNYQVAIEELDTYGKQEFDFTHLMKKISEDKHNIIGITSLSSHLEVIKSLINQIKKDFPEVNIVAGGVHATALPEDLLDIGADIVVLGEAETIFLKIVEHLENNIALDNIPSLVFKKKESGHYFRTPSRTGYEDVKSLPWPAYHLINTEHYFANNYAIRGYWLRCGWVFTARGCPGMCTFCASAPTHGYRIRERDIQDVVSELEYLKQRFRIEAFWILDDTFVIKQDRIIEFCDELKKRKLNLTWACQGRVNFFTNKVAKALKESGCVQVDFGVESGSQKVLNRLKKGITVERTKNAFSIAHKNRLRALATIMIGCPEETWDDIRLTKELLDQIQPDYLGIGFCTPYPGSELYKEARVNKWVDFENLKWDTEGHNARPIMFINFNEKELYQIYNSLVRDSFYNTICTYIRQKKFLRDLLKNSFMHPDIISKIFLYSLCGKRKDAINLFRKFRITGA